MPDDITAWVRRELERLKAAYEDGNLGAVHDAVWRCSEHNLPLPKWVNSALLGRNGLIMGYPKKGSKSRIEKWVERYKKDIIDYVRWELVSNYLKEREIPFNSKELWEYYATKSDKQKKQETDRSAPPEAIFHVASMMLLRTPAAGTADVIRSSYSKVKKTLKTNPKRYYLLHTITVYKEDQRVTQEQWDEWQKILTFKKRQKRKDPDSNFE